MKPKHQRPTYDLAVIQSYFQEPDDINMTMSAADSIAELGWIEEWVVEAIQALTPDHFYKTMAPTNKRHKYMQDVYNIEHRGVPLYIKFQRGQSGKTYLLLSFKEDTSGTGY